MAMDRTQLRWNGWGKTDVAAPLQGSQEDFVLAELANRLGGKLGDRSTPAALSDATLPDPQLTDEARNALAAAVGDKQLHTDNIERAIHAAGKSLPDLLRVRSGQLTSAPDAVVYPLDSQAVAATLRAACQYRLSIVPFGGGTSVVGGVQPVRGDGQASVVTLDTTRMNALLNLDTESRTATFQAGVDGPALEAELGERGYTLGHFPQSFEHSTLGGWIAARSSGQQSDGYGGIDSLLVGVRVVTPEGEIQTLTVPRTAAGPSLKELILGSEGVLGVIVEATVRIRPKPAVQDIRGMIFPNFRAGTEAIREAALADLPMTIMRLSDSPETELSLLMRQDPARKVDPTGVFLRGLRSLGYGDQRSVMLYGIEGDSVRRVGREMKEFARIGKRHGGMKLGSGPGKKWQADRFHTPYLRDYLLDRGVAIDTMETAFEWKRLVDAHDEVLTAMRQTTEKNAGGGIAMGHVSHSYHDGACVYFVVIYALDVNRGVEQWQLIKTDITNAIVKAGGTVSHHHGVGMDHAPWMESEQGVLGCEALRAIKTRLDPDGIMNPGKLL
jgi:alkyldihydroxyacetonephosphate synthase